tara:strand:- start:150118 stop:150297 length:180 start_codon:yes stop_codon:yes gene_type:complete
MDQIDRRQENKTKGNGKPDYVSPSINQIPSETSQDDFKIQHSLEFIFLGKTISMPALKH